MIKRLTLILAIALATSAVKAQQNSSTPPQLPGKVAIVQHMGAQLPLNAMFRDDTGRVVRLGDYFKSGRPVLLDFMYYRCPMLCSMVLEGTTTALTELKLDVGKDFDVITVSIDPRDMPDDARAKKEKYVKRYGRASAYDGWHFLTAHESAIKRLTNTVGFEYAYDPKSDQFAHGTVLIAVTPQGKVSKYFYGFEYKPRDLRLGLVEASEGKVGTAVDQLLLLCFHYSPSTGKYSAAAMNIMRAGGAATILGLGGFIFIMIRNERRNEKPPQ
ncbi:MAG TPA: SCO family protein [Thermoanaerobaculia bacterium]